MIYFTILTPIWIQFKEIMRVGNNEASLLCKIMRLEQVGGDAEFKKCIVIMSYIDLRKVLVRFKQDPWNLKDPKVQVWESLVYCVSMNLSISSSRSGHHFL